MKAPVPGSFKAPAYASTVDGESDAPSLESSFTVRRVQELLGLSRAVIGRLIAAGFVCPVRGARNEYRFSFQDLMVLRTAHGLCAARIPPARVVRALDRLRVSLPRDMPLSGLRISAIGGDVVVRDRGGHWQADSGQLLMDFEVATIGGQLAFLPGFAASVNDRAQWFSRGQALEATDIEAAASAYRQAIALDPSHVDAYLDLGAMLCEAGRCDEAAALYEAALQTCPDCADVHFNHAIALEDQGRVQDAIDSYERCLAVDPDLADAHYNCARLRERVGDLHGALRDFSAYRRLRID